MSFTPAICPKCHALLLENSSRKKVICPYCNESFTLKFGAERYSACHPERTVFDKEEKPVNNDMDFIIIDGSLKKYIGSEPNVIIPKEVKAIEPYAFYYSNMETVEIPGSVKVIYPEAFLLCDNLKSVIINDGTEEVYANAFKDCFNLLNITVPASVAKFGTQEGGLSSQYSIQCSCDNLKTITYLTSDINNLKKEEYLKALILSMPNSDEKFHALKESKLIFKDYKLDCPNITKTLAENSDDDGFVIINDELVLYKGSSENIVIPDGVNFIKKYAFCTSPIKSVTVPESVKGIEDYAFYSCSELSEVKLCEGLEEIGNSVFCGCNLKEITVPASVKSCDLLYCKMYDTRSDTPKDKSKNMICTFLTPDLNNALNCISSESLFAHRHDEEISYDFDFAYSFYKFPNIKDELLKHIKDDSFLIVDDSLLTCSHDRTKVIVPDGVRVIEFGAFADFTELKEVVLPESVEEIKDYAFCRCFNLEKINLNDNIKLSGDRIFKECCSLE